MDDLKNLNGSDTSDLKVDENVRKVDEIVRISVNDGDQVEAETEAKVEDVVKSPTEGGSTDSVDVIDDDDDDDVIEDVEEEEEEEEDAGNPDKAPGEDAVREIDADHLLPFFHGWKREVVVRKGDAKVRGSNPFFIFNSDNHDTIVYAFIALKYFFWLLLPQPSMYDNRLSWYHDIFYMHTC